MSDEKRYTEREMIEEQRAAFITGVNARARIDVGDPWDGAAFEAARRYPFPKVQRVRIWVEPRTGMGFKVIAGELYATVLASGEFPWERIEPVDTKHEITPERIRAWADLLANPTELVEL